MTDGGTTQANTTREHVGSLSWEKRTLKRLLVEVREGEDLSKPSPGTRAAGPLSRRRGGAYQQPMIQQVASDEGLGYISIK